MNPIFFVDADVTASVNEASEKNGVNMPMRNLIFSILGSMGLALLGLPAFLSPDSTAGSSAEKGNFHSAIDFGAGQLPLRAVADDEQNNKDSNDEEATTDDNQDDSSDHSADNDTDDSGSVTNDTSKSTDQDDAAKTPQFYHTRRPHGPNKALQVDLSDLVIRPV